MTQALVELIPAHVYRRVRWQNGRGWTREIATASTRGEPGRDGWSWRVSIAEIEEDGPFSLYSGVERECILLRGEGFALESEGEDSRVLRPPFGRLRFPGDVPVAASLLDGRVEVFNLMWRPDAVETASWHRPLVGAMFVFVDPGSCWIVHVLAGTAQVNDHPGPAVLDTGDTALLHAGDRRARHGIEGGGELLLIRIDPLR